MPDLHHLKLLVASSLNWEGWEQLIDDQGYTIDRAYRTAHPRYPTIIYPINYGYVNGTLGTDGDELDVFVGSGETGLVGAILTTDYRQGDREVKLLYHCTPEEIYLTHGFINFDRTLLEGTLVLRDPLHDLWARSS
jgi:inorganic pyrophosphatase